MVYMDDLKLYAKDDSELKALFRFEKGFSDATGMDSGLSKCTKATFTRGELKKSDHVQLDEETTTKDLE